MPWRRSNQYWRYALPSFLSSRRCQAQVYEHCCRENRCTGQTVLVWVTLLEPFLALLAVGFDLVQQVGLRFLAVDLVVALRQLRLPLRIVLLLLGLVLVQVSRLTKGETRRAGNGALLGHLL